jgi:circadian clock protein KaiB
MKKSESNKELANEALELAASGTEQKYLLRLYIAGSTPQSNRAVANIKIICEEHLKGQYELEVVDLYEKPYLAAGEQIIAAPTLIKQLPLPLRRIIGDMSDTDRVLVGLDLRRANQK